MTGISPLHRPESEPLLGILDSKLEARNIKPNKRLLQVDMRSNTEFPKGGVYLAIHHNVSLAERFVHLGAIFEI